MEKQKINIKYCLGFVICVFLFLWIVLTFVAYIMPMGTEKLDNYFNHEQEMVDERFIKEYSRAHIVVYHDNELNVTCYRITNTGLSCIPDAEIGRS